MLGVVEDRWTSQFDRDFESSRRHLKYIASELKQWGHRNYNGGKS